ncbi:MAG: glycosyltransferase [Leptolyngbya sp. SIO4C1]|nr:glycosyltransferase [Leptolyngbya sp. SIO4C1]
MLNCATPATSKPPLAPSPQPTVGVLLKTFPKLSETFILNELLELERQGVHLHIFSLRSPAKGITHPAVAQLRAPVTYLPSLLPEPEAEAESQLLNAGLYWFRQGPSDYLKMLQFYMARTETRRLNELLQAGYLAQLLQHCCISHLHVHFANIPAATAELATQLYPVPYSITAHAKDIYLSEPAALNRRIARAEFVLTCTDYNRRYLQSIADHHTPIHLAYHGLDLTRFSPLAELTPEKPPALPASTPLLLSVGRFCEKKGFTYLLDACAELKQRNIAFHCAIVGYGPLQAAIEQQIADLGLTAQVTLLGQLTQDRLVQVYQQADIFVLPCQVTEEGDRDGIPNVLLEAMAMTVPVISTQISGIVELIKSNCNGRLVPQKDASALAQEMAALIEQPDLRERLGQRGQRTVQQRFALENNVAQVKRLLLQSIEKHTANTVLAA